MKNEFREKFCIEEYTLFESQYWVVSLRPKQPTLGALLLSVKSDCSSFSELSDSETKDLSLVFRKIEMSLKGLFDYEKINYLALMMIDDHVHFHVLPRYSRSRTFNGKEYVDVAWPAQPDILSSVMEIETLKNLYKVLKLKFDEAEY